LQHLNWIDLLAGSLFARVVYIGIKRGFVVELFKLAGTIVALYITLHYCTVFSKLLHEKLHLQVVLSDILSFGFLWGAITLTAKLVRDTLLMLVHIEPQGILNKWGGLILSIFRGLLLASLTLVYFEVTNVESFQKYIRDSITGKRLVRMAPDMYEGCYDGFIVKFFPKEELNKSILKGKNPHPVNE
jgi:uncharacterized membrane protein required for colicin V production